MNCSPLKIAFYGKGGIGKSTVAANTAAAFGKLGKKVLFIGCDPKADSTRTIIGRKIKPLITVLLEKEEIFPEDFIHTTDNKVFCMETGGPKAGTGCAGRGIITMMEELENQKILEQHWDVIIYDVLGDVVCGGFAVPMREQYVDKVYVVTSSEYMSLYAANNIMKSIVSFSEDQDPFFGGIIYNQRNNQPDDALINSFAAHTDSAIAAMIPFDQAIILSELEAKTALFRYPQSKAAVVFSEFAKKMPEDQVNVPRPLEEDELDEFFKGYLLKSHLKEEFYVS